MSKNMSRNRNDQLYYEIYEYAKARRLKNTLIALPVAREVLRGVTRTSYDFNRDGTLDLTYYEHCFATARLLISLNLDLTRDEEDKLIAATLCHDMSHIIKELDVSIYDIIDFLGKQAPTRDDSKQEYYDAIQTSKLPLLLALADRGNLMEHLYQVSPSEATLYVHDTRKYFLPMCIYGKEHFPNLQPAIQILMEKLRCLSDVTDIITTRYEKQENAYNNEIISLMEENARMRVMIARLKKRIPRDK